jgi:hypothetical protein
MSAELSRQDFETRIGQAFDVSAGDLTVALRLFEVRALGEGLRPGGAFSANFTGPSTHALPQATYRLSNPELGDVDLFIVPVGRNGEGQFVYEAVFT